MFQDCDIKWSGNSLASLGFLILFPPVFYIVMRLSDTKCCFRQQLSFRKLLLNWSACKRLSELLYTALFFFVVLEAGKFFDITCYVEREVVDENGATTFVPDSIQCEELGCEVLWYADIIPDDCQTCRRHHPS